METRIPTPLDIERFQHRMDCAGLIAQEQALVDNLEYGHAALGLYHSDRMIGVINFSSNGACIMIDYLFVEPAYRGHGYGKELVDLVETKFPGVKKILYPFTVAARYFFEKLGYVCDKDFDENRIMIKA